MEIVTEIPRSILSKAVVNIQGMTCASCVRAIENSLRTLPSVQPGSVSVNLLMGQATLMASQDLLPEAVITETIENAGYDVTGFKYTDPIPTTTSATKQQQLLQQQSQLPTHYRACLTISGMFCSSCTSKVENLIQTLPGVISTTVKVSLATGNASFEYKSLPDRETALTTTTIGEQIRDLGFEADHIGIEKLTTTSSGESTFSKDDSQTGPALTTTRLDISGMTCASCVGSIESVLSDHPGVHQVQVNLLAKSGTIVHDPTLLGVRDLLSMIEDMGFDASLAADDSTTNRNILQEKIRKEERMLRKRLLWSLVFAVPMFIVAMVIMMMLPKDNPARVWLMQELVPGLRIQDVIMFCLATPVQFWLGRPFYQKAYKAIRYTRTANMETLVALGTSVAYFASLGSIIGAMVRGAQEEQEHQMTGETMQPSAGVDFFETSVFLIFFINLGKWLEAMAKGKTAETITKLLDLQPETATLLNTDGETTSEIQASLIQVGDILVVNAGGRIPCDGLLWKGNTTVDEAMITGESLPVTKTERKSTLISASINLTAAIQVKATKVGKDTTLSRIIQLVQDAQASPKAPIEALGDKISGVFVPVVILLGLMTFAGWAIAGQTGGVPEDWLPAGVTYWVYATLFAVSVFVIACPCALGLASPAAVMVGTGVAAKHGILIKGGGFALEMAKRLDIVVFDKTGTLTTGKPRLTDSWIFPTTPAKSSGMVGEKSSLELILQILGKVEASSSHPVALAVAKGATDLLHKSPAEREEIEKEPISGNDQEELDVTNEESVLLQKQFNHVKIAHMREVAGRGLSATVMLGDYLDLAGYGQFRALNVFVGNEKWMTENGAHYPINVAEADRKEELGRWQSEGKSVVLCAVTPAVTNEPSSSSSLSKPVVAESWMSTATTAAPSASDSTCKCELCTCIDCNCTTKLGSVPIPLIVAQVAVADTARPEAKQVIEGLKAQGIETWMLTGDHPTTAKAIASSLGITNIIAGVLPEDKAQKVKQLQNAGRPVSQKVWSAGFWKRKGNDGNNGDNDQQLFRQMRPAIVAMVGDGINDSPALAQSNLGISVGSATDIAIEAASIVLLRDTLTDLLVMRDLAKTTVRRIQINFGWAFMYNVVMIPVAAGVLVPWNRSAVIGPAWAGLAMAVSSVSVVISSLRLRSYKYKAK